MISVELASQRILPGGVVRGTVQWQAEGRPPKRVVVDAKYGTSGRGHTDTAVIDEVELEVGDMSFDTVPFELRLPSDVPCTYHGHLFAIEWIVEARLDMPWARDETTEVTLTVEQP